MGLTHRQGGYLLEETLLYGVASTSKVPEWKMLFGIVPATITCEGEFEGVVTVYVSNNAIPPTGRAKNFPVCCEFREPGTHALKGPYRFACAMFERKKGSVTVGVCGATGGSVR